MRGADPSEQSYLLFLRDTQPGTSTCAASPTSVRAAGELRTLPLPRMYHSWAVRPGGFASCIDDAVIARCCSGGGASYVTASATSS